VDVRLIFWNCNMAFHRKIEAILPLKPDIAVISECAAPDVLSRRELGSFDDETCLWMGRNPNKGLGVFTFGGLRLKRVTPFYPTLDFILPVHVSGAQSFNLLAVWAQNNNSGNIRKHTLGPMRRGLTKYRGFLYDGPSIIGGDLNNNVYWDKPGWRINHAKMVATANGLGLVSAYHEVMKEPQGEESIPTHYWRDRKKDGPTYHIDYAFVPEGAQIDCFEVGVFEDWIGNGLSDHVPLILDITL
jgi:exodeoxyribonuclease-3